jgi:fumarate reductase flavoprotein subunit
MRRGKSVKTRHGDHLWLDITLLGPEHIRKALREVYEICQGFLGIDPTRDWIPVRPAQHYSMGGIRTDPAGHSPHLRGLFACGEAACWDLHGFNRLGGNSVAETVVAGMIVGESIADWCDGEGAGATVPMGLVREHWEQVDAELAGILGRTGGESALELMGQMQRVMADHVCVFRSGPVLQLALEELQGLLRRSAVIAVRSRAPGANPELVDAYRVRRMLRLALCVVAGALARTERTSRGATTPAGSSARSPSGATRTTPCRPSTTSRSTSPAWSCRPAGGVTAARATSSTPTRRGARPRLRRSASVPRRTATRHRSG